MAQSKLRYISDALRDHAPFTFIGTVLGVIFMFLFKNASEHTNFVMFNIFHPGHVFLSAIVTAALFKLRSRHKNFLLVLVIGWLGAVGTATLSDSIIPYVGEWMLGFQVSEHGPVVKQGADEHGPELAGHEGHEGHDRHEHGGWHIGFIESWYIVNPAALLGIIIAYFWPYTKVPHAGHILLSIWASLFHILMAMGGSATTGQWVGIVFFLFIAVWIPCCFSDIVFPLLFVKPGEELPEHVCGCGRKHDHGKI